MPLSPIFDIAGSGMHAQSVRLNTTASNLANAETVSSSVDETYRARKPLFSAVQQQVLAGNAGAFASDANGQGVNVKGIVESDAPLQQRYQPGHPMANEEGYVYYPNVDVVEEMADMMSASRGYQLNVEVMNSAKTMMQRLLTLGQ